MANYWYFKCLSPNHPAMLPIVIEHGMEGFGYACALLSEAAEQNCYYVTLEHLKKWLNLRTQKAQKLLPSFQKLLKDFAELSEITVVIPEITTIKPEITEVKPEITPVILGINPVIPEITAVKPEITAVTEASNPVIAENSVLAPLYIDKQKEINIKNRQTENKKPPDPLLEKFSQSFLNLRNPNLLNSSANEMVFRRIIAQAREKGYQDKAIYNAWLLALESCVGKNPTGLSYYEKVFDRKLLECDIGTPVAPKSMTLREKLEQATRYLDQKTSQFYQASEVELGQDTFRIISTNEEAPITRLTAV